jgi:hypothetical protein
VTLVDFRELVEGVVALGDDPRAKQENRGIRRDGRRRGRNGLRQGPMIAYRPFRRDWVGLPLQPGPSSVGANGSFLW